MPGWWASSGGVMGGSGLMSMRCEESRWPKSVVNGLLGWGPGDGELREMEARVFFRPSNRLIPYGLAETPGIPGDAPVGPTNSCIRRPPWTGCGLALPE